MNAFVKTASTWGKGIWLSLIGIISILVILSSTVGINDNGFRTVVQWPNGTTFVKFKPGVYFSLFGPTWQYNDEITFDHDRTVSDSGASSTLDQRGISVRYQDGGTGTIYGKSRYSLPDDEPTMLLLHKAFRSNTGVATKLIKAVVEESMNLTAGLMGSEEAYTEKRGTFIQWAQQQVTKGKFQTELKQITTTDEVGKTVVKNIPVISYGKNGLPVHLRSDLATYGISTSGFQIMDWGFEPKTLKQISTKREATMAIITAKANAERAKQDAITAEEQGKADVMTARYKKEVLKVQAIVDAEREKKVATIAAERKVAVAKEIRNVAEQKKLTAVEYKAEQILRGEGDAAYKQLVLEADGALEQKLKAYTTVNNIWAKAYAQRAVPQFMMGGATGGAGSNTDASMFQSMLNAQLAKDLVLNTTISK